MIDVLSQHMMFIYPICVYSYRLFSFQYYVMNFTILPKLECMNIYCHFMRDHESVVFQS